MLLISTTSAHIISSHSNIKNIRFLFPQTQRLISKMCKQLYDVLICLIIEFLFVTEFVIC